MQFTCTVSVSSYFADDDHKARVGFRVHDAAHDTPGEGCGTGWKHSEYQTFDTAPATRTWKMWNFQPGVEYDYIVIVGLTSPAITCGVLGTPELPENLANLNLEFDGAGGFATDYVLLDSGDCGEGTGEGAKEYLIAIDTNTEAIVWYLDVDARSILGGSGKTEWRYQDGTSSPTTNRFLATVDRRYLYEWRWDGTVVDAKDFGSGCAGGSGASGPCPSHDAFQSDDTGRTYVLTSKVSSEDRAGTPWASLCTSSHRFVDDGYQGYSSVFAATTFDDYLITRGRAGEIRDPDTDFPTNLSASSNDCGAFWGEYFDSAYPPIDWVHPNSISAVKPSPYYDELLNLSFRRWNQVWRVNVPAEQVEWILAGDDGYTDPDFDQLTLDMSGSVAGTMGFAGQHAVYSENGSLQMFDNSGDAEGARVLRLYLSGVPLDTAEITHSWQVFDPGTEEGAVCAGQGSGITVPGTSYQNVLAMCTEEHLIEELDDSDGLTESWPPLVISLPSADFCAADGPADVSDITGWYRAFPVSALGQY